MVLLDTRRRCFDQMVLASMLSWAGTNGANIPRDVCAQRRPNRVPYDRTPNKKALGVGACGVHGCRDHVRIQCGCVLGTWFSHAQMHTLCASRVGACAEKRGVHIGDGAACCATLRRVHRSIGDNCNRPVSLYIAVRHCHFVPVKYARHAVVFQPCARLYTQVRM